MHRLDFSRFACTTALALAVSFSAVATAHAQQAAPELPAPSPHAKIEQRVGLTDFSIDYSSPGVKGRKIWGGLVPYDQVWRTGANSATKLTVSRDITFGGKPVKAGTYAFYTIPGKTSWTVILSSNVNAWGANGYDDKQDVVRVMVKPTAVPSRERMAFIFSDATDDAVAIDLEWEKVRVRVPVKLDTAAAVKGNIERATADAWRPHFASARYLLESGGDLGQALAFVDKSIAIQETWWNQWVRAQILAKQGKKADAVAAGEKAQALGKGDQTFEGFFKADVDKAVAGWKK
jgi:hypothetical protein